MNYLKENSLSSDGKRKKIRIEHILEFKKSARKIAATTCYDASFARILELTQIDIVLVGDSLGNVIQGHDLTLAVTVENIEYHVKCVRKGLKTPLLVADMPFLSAGGASQYCVMQNAGRLMRAGAEAVKIEGSTPEILEHISFLTRHGIPVLGHLGLMPQSIHTLSGYKIQGKSNTAQQKLLQDAQALQEAGCFAVVLELIVSSVANEMTRSLNIPTIGIGCGNVCDGNILVLNDLLGMSKNFKPKFLKHFSNLEENIQNAVNTYCQEVQASQSEIKHE